MNEHLDFALLQEALIVLGAVAIVVPVFHRIRVSPIIGFLLIGMALGPGGLGALLRALPGLDWLAISDRARIGGVAEFGVVLLLFMIGLELSFARLGTMRRLVFGLGPLQVALSAGALMAIGVGLGLAGREAAVIGLALALSSTAIVIQVLSEEKRLHTAAGRTSFAVLVFQDMAVVPILFAVAMLAQPERAGVGAFALSFAQAAFAVLLVIAAGRLLLRPLFRSVARTQSPEVFMAACLLVLLAAGAATAAAGLSMALGALIAGMLLAETEYRRQIEVMIEPFKGLLLGVFLISVGMTIDLDTIAAAPLVVAGALAALIGVKGALTYALARLFRINARCALETALLLAPAGEFSLVVLGAATSLSLLTGAAGDLALIVVTLSMALIPLLSRLGQALAPRAPAPSVADLAALAPGDLGDAPRVIIAGYGRVGRVVADMLKAHSVDFIALDANADVVAKARAAGDPAYYGDSTNPDLLRRCGLATARALVVTMESGQNIEAVVSAARAARADLLIVARARDARHAARLYAKGASDAVPETVEASLLLSETLLVDIGVPMGPVIASIHDRRAQFRAEIQALAPEADVRPARRRLLRDRLRPPAAP